MTDEYLWQKGNTLAIRNGRRSSFERRQGEERRSTSDQGIFANLSINRRNEERRNYSFDRRRPKQLSLNEKLMEMAGSMSIGVLCIILGIISIITGLTFFPVAGVALGGVMVMAGLVFIFIPI